jgi:hypothetical protein
MESVHAELNTMDGWVFFLFAILLLAGLGVFLFSWRRLASLKSVDKLFIFGWLFIFTWGFGGVALAILTHQTFFLLRGVLAVFGIIVFVIASIFWLAYRMFRANVDAENRKTTPKS